MLREDGLLASLPESPRHSWPCPGTGRRRRGRPVPCAVRGGRTSCFGMGSHRHLGEAGGGATAEATPRRKEGRARGGREGSGRPVCMGCEGRDQRALPGGLSTCVLKAGGSRLRRGRGTSTQRNLGEGSVPAPLPDRGPSRPRRSGWHFCSWPWHRHLCSGSSWALPWPPGPGSLGVDVPRWEGLTRAGFRGRGSGLATCGQGCTGP